FLALAEEARLKRTESDRQTWLARLDTEQDNLRAALAWGRESREDPNVGLRLAGALGWYWDVRGFQVEGREQLRLALAQPEAEAPTSARAYVLHELGWLTYRSGDYARARALTSESLEIRERLGDLKGMAASLIDLGGIIGVQGDHPLARSLLERALTLSREG